MARLFGTDGVRGVVNEGLTPELAFQLGRAAAVYFGQQEANPHFLIGRDTRISGTMLTAALAAGICSAGGSVDDGGVLPTPAVAYLTKTGAYAAGVVISASHNPFPDNGIKFFDGEGYKLPDEVEYEMERLLRADETESIRPTGGQIGTIAVRDDLVEQYIGYIVATAPQRLDRMKVVVDTANGAASRVTTEVLSRLGAEVIAMADTPDGVNINAGCGSTHPEALQAAVLAEHAHAGVANDGDADRCLLVDEQGHLLDGDHIMFLCAMQLKQQNKLAADTVVGTVMSNIGFRKAIESIGAKTVFTSVGDRYVLAEMRANGYSLGGEQSGHIIFLDYNTTGDGVMTAVQALGILQESGLPLSELAAKMQTYPQLLVNVPVYDKEAWQDNPLILSAIADGESELGEDGRILVRASGTEPLVRVMAEGPEMEQLERIVGTIAQAIEREIGAARD